MNRPALPLLALLPTVLGACGTRSADLLLTNAPVYTLAWEQPGPDGAPALDAPYAAADGWHPDAEAVAIRNGRILFVGTAEDAEAYRGANTEVLDLDGATVLPGLVDSHTHVAELVLCSQSLFRFADLGDNGLCRGDPDKGCGVIVSAIDVVVDRLD